MDSAARSRKRAQRWSKRKAVVVQLAVCFVVGAFAPLVATRGPSTDGIGASFLPFGSVQRVAAPSPPAAPDIGLLLIVTVTRPDEDGMLQEASLTRLGHTLRLVPPPLVWIVVGAENRSASTVQVLRSTGVMFRHLTYAVGENNATNNTTVEASATTAMNDATNNSSMEASATTAVNNATNNNTVEASATTTTITEKNSTNNTIVKNNATNNTIVKNNATNNNPVEASATNTTAAAQKNNTNNAIVENNATNNNTVEANATNTTAAAQKNNTNNAIVENNATNNNTVEANATNTTAAAQKNNTNNAIVENNATNNNTVEASATNTTAAAKKNDTNNAIVENNATNNNTVEASATNTTAAAKKNNTNNTIVENNATNNNTVEASITNTTLAAEKNGTNNTIVKNNATGNAGHEADLQRNVALSHIERHRLAGVVHFAASSAIYDLRFFEELRQTRGVAAWPTTTVSSADQRVTQGPTCNSSQITGWYSKDSGTNETHGEHVAAAQDTGAIHNISSSPLAIEISGLGFRSSVLWESEWFINSNSSSGGSSQDFIQLVRQMAVGDGDERKGIPSDCSESRILLWHLDMPKHTPEVEEQETPQEQSLLEEDEEDYMA